MRTLWIMPFAACALAISACGGGAPPPKTGGQSGGGKEVGAAVGANAKSKYEATLKNFVSHDSANDWNNDTCAAVAKDFQDANELNKKEAGSDLPQALYDAGLAYQRCNNDGEAKKLFQQTLAIDPKFHRAKVQVALYDYKAGGDGALESTIATLQQAVLDAEFQNPDALVNIAMLRMKRGGSVGGDKCNDDYDCAKRSIQQALAIDDSFMPAFNQLAIYYLERAKAKVGRGRSKAVSSGRKEKKVDQQQLELASLVCSQAIRKNPKYAPIHNTSGLILVELGNINGAVQEFKTATQLDPTFFEALMNYAAVNTAFRGFKNADDAYRAALKIKPSDCDANLGLALAIRGEINDTNLDQNVKEAQGLLDKVKQTCADRAETYYNEGILTQEYKVKTVMDDKAKIPIYDQAVSIYNTFVQKAGSSPEYSEAVKRVQERIKDINDVKTFIVQGIRAEEDMSKPQLQPEGLEGSSEDNKAEGEKPKP